MITPGCIFDFDTDAGRMRVHSIHPDVTPAALPAATGVDLGDPTGLPPTALPTPESLELRRRPVDPNGILPKRPS